MHNIFIDVGGHEGQTLEEVVSDRYRFDQIYCFEPMRAQYESIMNRFSKPALQNRLSVLHAGLVDHNGRMNLYGTNADMGASIFKQKSDLDDPSTVTECDFLRASDFFRENIVKDDRVILKLNCEGSEFLILHDLMSSGEIWKIANVMIDFDVRKIPGMESEEARLLKRLEEEEFTNYSLCDSVMIGRTHQLRIRNWLSGLDCRDEIMAPENFVERFLRHVRLRPRP